MKANWVELKDIKSDQQKSVEKPDVIKPYDNTNLIDLPEPDQNDLKIKNIDEVFQIRRSRRQFTDSKMSLTELSYLLHSTQRVQKTFKENIATLRPVPSAGARHPFETYLVILNVQDLDNGIYRYLPDVHKLIYLHTYEGLKEKMIKSVMDQKWAGETNVVFYWSCIPYRAEWRYSIKSHKAMLLDAGHICQNLYLAAESMKYGTCAIAAYDQELSDQLLKLDGEDEFTVYISPVGKQV
ncbi:MAG: SagB/ThcOx family dehydrogenase [Candidatus Delongbacteria bacterium]|nr:SagB/ThcOx family dehydrogenase [Candidatus Delongbacteria bacterium]